MSARAIGLGLLAITILFGLAPLVLVAEDIPTAQHHLLHAVLLAGAAVAGVLCAGTMSRQSPSAVGWLLVAMISPVLAMLLMWPSEYAYFETHRYGHAIEHLGIIGFGFLTGFGGQRFAPGIGWAASLSVVAMAVLGVWGYGVGPVIGPGPVASAPTVASSSVGSPNVVHGAAIFKQDCAACHGATGEGGAGPSLRNEGSRKNLALAEAWIEHPAPPMPQLYPQTLSAQDVADVAAYVETLK